MAAEDALVLRNRYEIYPILAMYQDEYLPKYAPENDKVLSSGKVQGCDSSLCQHSG